jgi:transposase
LKAGTEIINIDESIIRSTDHRKRGWALAKNRILVSKALRLPQISMIAAISSEGRVFFTINQGKTTSLTFLLFLSKLCRQLDTKDRQWRKSTLFLLDNASFHKSERAMEGYNAMGLPIMFLGPYSFNMAAVEKLFSFVKNRDLNPLATRAYSR